MDLSPDLSQVSMVFLCYRCGEETERFFLRKEHDPRYCYELFRRAIVTRDEVAWNCLYHRYQKLVAGWAERHSLFALVNEDPDVLVNEAFAKMWQGLTAEKFDHFADLKAVLRYLQMCVGSVIIDMARAVEKRQQVEVAVESRDDGALENTVDDSAAAVPDMEEVVFSQHQAEVLWQLLKTRIKNEKEYRVIFGMYVLALKPAEVLEQYPRTFQDVREIYLVKDNLLARLRRDAEFKTLYEEL